MAAHSFRIRLALIVAAGAVWRLGYLFAVKIDDSLLLNDSIYYSIQAGRNSEGAWFREALTDLPGAEHGPLTSLWLTPWSLGAGDNVGRQRFAMTLLGIATVAVIGLVGARLGGQKVGLVAAGIAAAYPNLWINDSLVMSETMACLLVALALLVALDYHESPSLGRVAVLGGLVGLGTLTRSEVALCAVGFAILGFRRARGHPQRAMMPVLLLVTAGLVVAPWALYNLARFERPTLLSTNDGSTLLGANCDATYYDDIGGWTVACLPIEQPGGPTEPSERSAQRRDLAWDYVSDHWQRVPTVVAARVGRVLDVYGLESLVRLDVGEEKAHWAVWAGIFSWWLLAGAAVFGWRAARTPREGRHGPVLARSWLAVMPAAVLITTVLFYGAHRIRAPAEPAVIVLGAFGFVAGWDRMRARRNYAAGTGSVDNG